MSFATAKYAYGLCDQCGQRYKLKRLKKQWDGIKSCPQCFDTKHPQLQPKNRPADPEALRDPRPNTDVEIFSGKVITDDVIGSNLNGLRIVSSLGSVEAGANVAAIPDTSTPILTGQNLISSLGTPTINTNVTIVPVSGLVATSSLPPSIAVTTNVIDFSVTVAFYAGGNRYYIDGTVYPTLNLSEGSTYRFDQSDSSNSGHPLRFSTTANGTHGGGSQYTTGVTTGGTPGNAGAYTQITVAVGAPTLYYYCTNHSGMGGQANTP